MIHDLIKLTAKHARPLSWLAVKLVASEDEIQAAVAAARRNGTVIRIVDGYVSSRPPIGECKTATFHAKAKPGRYHVAHVTDVHAGSRHALLPAMSEFLDFAARKRGCRAAVFTGDLLDGFSEKLLLDQDKIGYDHQASALLHAVRVGGKLYDSMLAIDGNHDGYNTSGAGAVSGRMLESDARSMGLPWTFLGLCLGSAVIHRARWRLWHPHGGASTRNAVRRVLNERGEAESEPFHIIAMGHFHKFVSLPIFPERVHGVAGGTYQTKASEFSNRMTRGWDVGGVIVSYRVFKDGQIGEISADFHPATQY